MANRTVKDAVTIKGTNPQYIVEKIIRTRIYESKYWKEECFALTAELLVDKAMDIKYIGGTFGGNIKPTPFICLALKMLQIQPEKDIVLEFIKNADYKYVRCLGAFYLRLTGSAKDCYNYLEPLFNDYRKIKLKNRNGVYELSHIDEFVESLLTAEMWCGQSLPRIQKRHILEENNEIEPRVSALDDDLMDMSSEDDTVPDYVYNSEPRAKLNMRRDPPKSPTLVRKSPPPRADRGRSRSPPAKRGRSRSPVAKRPEGARNHSPVEKRRSPEKRRSRSPEKRRSRSPEKRRSRSPEKRRSRSPEKRRSRSPEKRRPREPSPDLKRRSPERRRSPRRSPDRSRSYFVARDMASNKNIPKPVKFAFGGIAGMGATVFVQPLDLLKNRMQLSGEGGAARAHRTVFHAAISVVKSEGVPGLYRGLSAGLARQLLYTTTRVGIYTSLFDSFSGEDGSPPGFFTKAGCALTAGAIGSFVGTPAEISLIRMTADGGLPPEKRRNYKGVLNAFSRIAKEEGIGTLWRGCGPTVGRAIVVNIAQLVTYSSAKERLLGSGYFKDNIFCHFTSSMISGLATTIASMPVDICKTRIQNMKVVNGVPEYKGAVDVFLKIVRNEGFFSLWKGFTPYYARIGPHTVLMFIFLEQLNKTYVKVAGL
eukprot:sb/3462863/